MREILEIILGGDGYEVRTAPAVASACEILARESFDCVLTDLRMGSDREAGMKLLEWLQANTPGTASIMMTAFGSVETAIEAMKRGACDYVMKPFKNDEVRLQVRRAIEQRALERENRALRNQLARRSDFPEIIGTSEAIEDVREMVRRVATLPSTVAIHGESGTGKELVARGIHRLSDRSKYPMVAINCGAFPENLLESELFGHKKGSFTGAIEDKDGLFVVANGGILFLDEVGEMPPSLQVKLLRVLDNGLVTPVGCTASIPVDVRIISATNRDLEQMTREGTFREDLYYLPAQRHPAHCAAPARPCRRYPPARTPFCRAPLRQDEPPAPCHSPRDGGGAQGVPLAWQRARAAKCPRARRGLVS
jgi:two-component system, NtrC family, response regulator PilR